MNRFRKLGFIDYNGGGMIFCLVKSAHTPRINSA